MKRLFFLSCLINFLATICSADIIYVKNIQDSPNAWLQRNPVYTSIQSAVEAANDGDEIWVAKGIYFDSIVLKQDLKLFGGFEGNENIVSERILWNLKPISIIDGAGANRCILANFNNTIDGFTLQNGGNVDRGAGIYINNVTNIEIKNIFIESCTVSWKGAGIFIETDTTGTIFIERIIVWNCDSYCGSLEMDERSKSTLIIKNCTIANNDSYGLELPIHEQEDAEGNLTPVQPGTWDHSFINSICWNNANPYNIHSPNPETDTNDVWAWAREFLDYSYVGKNNWEDASEEGKWNGPKANNNFEKEPNWLGAPRFIDPLNGDFRLLNDSPCLDVGVNGDDLGAYPSNDIATNVCYYNLQRRVRNVSIGVMDDIGASSSYLTDGNGNCILPNIINGTSVITPSKLNDQNDAISGSDALLILQYLAFLTSLTEDQQIAADVTEDGSVSGSDAQAILRYLAFYSNSTGGAGEWRFDPDSLAFIVQKDTTANFKAYLLGDVNGDWSASSSTTITTKTKNSSFDLKLENILVGSKQILLIPVKIENLTQSLHTAVLTLEYDPKILTYQSTQKTDSSSSFIMATNGNDIGKVHIAMAGVKGIYCDNDLVQLIFTINCTEPPPKTSELLITRAFINDIPVDQIQNAKIYFKNSIQSIDSRLSFNMTNHPNPFNLTTTISFFLPDDADVTLTIFNNQGQHIKTLLTEKLAAGDHQVSWTATNITGSSLPAGIYFCRVEINTIAAKSRKLNRYSNKMFLLK